MNRQLLFKNPVFAKSPHDSGVLLTCRRGNKWAGRVLCGDVVDLVTTEGSVKIGEATIDSCMTLIFNHLKFQETTTLQLEHDPTCRNYAGLLKAMIQVYPGFAESETVTLVFFRPLA